MWLVNAPSKHETLTLAQHQTSTGSTPRVRWSGSANEVKAQSQIPSRTSSAQNNEEFWSVRRDSLGVCQNSLMIRRERRMNGIHSSCASTSAHIFFMFKIWAFFHVWMSTPEERRTSASLTLGTSRAHALNRCVSVDRCLSQSHINDAQSKHKKIKNNNFSADC